MEEAKSHIKPNRHPQSYSLDPSKGRRQQQAPTNNHCFDKEYCHTAKLSKAQKGPTPIFFSKPCNNTQ